MIKRNDRAISIRVLLSSLAYASAQTPASSASATSLGQSHFVRFGSNQVHYVTAGKGSRTLLFVHCWAGNTGFWREQVPVLGEKALLVLVDLAPEDPTGYRTL